MKIMFAGTLVLLAILSCSRSDFAPVGDLSTEVDSIFANYNQNEGPGCAVGVAREGQTQLLQGYGLASLEHKVPIKPETV